jgi:hypothetical protein
MGNANARIALLLPTLMAATTCFITQVSRAEDAPVSDSPQANPERRPWSASLHHESDRERPPGDPQVPDRSYTAALVSAYLAVPVIAVGATFGLGALSSNIEFSEILFGVIISGAAPAFVHFVNHREGRGLAAWLAVPGIFFGASFVISLVSLGVISAVRDSAEPTTSEREDGVLVANLPYALVCGAIGGALATAGWAIYDVLATQRLSDRANERASHASLRFSVMPTPTGVAAVLGGRF